MMMTWAIMMIAERERSAGVNANAMMTWAITERPRISAYARGRTAVAHHHRPAHIAPS